MAELRIEWDANKARINERKHGITFEEAETVFSDDNALLLIDTDHSTPEEERLVLIGMSLIARVLVVVHCERDGGDTIRLISARRPTKSERAQYDARWKR